MTFLEVKKEVSELKNEALSTHLYLKRLNNSHAILVDNKSPITYLHRCRFSLINFV